MSVSRFNWNRTYIRVGPCVSKITLPVVTISTVKDTSVKLTALISKYCHTSVCGESTSKTQDSDWGRQFK